MNDYWAWEEDTSHAKSVLKFGVQLIILVIHFWTEENNEIIPHSIDIGKCKFYESLDEGEEPYLKKGIGIFGNVLKYKFYLQKGTLMRECRLE